MKLSLTIIVISSSPCLSDFDWRGVILTLNYPTSEVASLRSNVIPILCSELTEVEGNGVSWGREKDAGTVG